MVLQLVNYCSSKNITRFVELFFSKKAEIPSWKFWFHYFHNKTTPIFCFCRLFMLLFLVYIYCMKAKVVFFPQISCTFVLKRAACINLRINKQIKSLHFSWLY